MAKNCVKQKIDIALLKERSDAHDNFMKNLEENHLPHIYESLSQIKIQQAYYAGGIAVAVILITHFWR